MTVVEFLAGGLFMGACVAVAAVYVKNRMVWWIISTEGKIMATIEEAAASVRTQFTALGDRVNTDVAELKRIIQEEGVSNDRVNAVIASLEATASDMASVDPLPDFPAAPPAGGGDTPPAGGGGDTPPASGGGTSGGGTPPAGGDTPGGTPTNGGATV